MTGLDDTEVTFDVKLEDGRVAHCREAVAMDYADTIISAGVVNGIPPDDLYFRFVRERDGGPWTFFLRRDEMLAISHCCTGALWSQDMLTDEETGE